MQYLLSYLMGAKLIQDQDLEDLHIEIVLFKGRPCATMENSSPWQRRPYLSIEYQVHSQVHSKDTLQPILSHY